MNLGPDTPGHLAKGAARRLQTHRFAVWLAHRQMVRAHLHRQSIARKIRYRRTPAAVARVRFLRKQREFFVRHPGVPF